MRPMPSSNPRPYATPNHLNHDLGAGAVSVDHHHHLTQRNRINDCASLIRLALVLSTESINTGSEELCDHVQPEQTPQSGAIKDTAAATACAEQVSHQCGGSLWNQSCRKTPVDSMDHVA